MKKIFSQLSILVFLVTLVSCNQNNETHELFAVDNSHYYLISSTKLNEIKSMVRKKDSTENHTTKHIKDIISLFDGIIQEEQTNVSLIITSTPEVEDWYWSDKLKELNVDSQKFKEGFANIYIAESKLLKDSEKVDIDPIVKTLCDECPLPEDYEFSTEIKFVKSIKWEGKNLKYSRYYSGYGAERQLQNLPGGLYYNDDIETILSKEIEPLTEERINSIVQNSFEVILSRVGTDVWDNNKNPYIYIRLQDFKKYPLREFDEMDSLKHPRFSFKRSVDSLRTLYLVKVQKENDSIARYQKRTNSNRVSQRDVQRDLEGQYMIQNSKDLGDSYIFLAIPYGTSNEGCIVKVSATSGRVFKTDCGPLQNASFTFEQY